MRITIDLDTAELTENDRALLRALGGSPQFTPDFVQAGWPGGKPWSPTAWAAQHGEAGPETVDLPEGAAVHPTEPVRGATDEEREAETLAEKPRRKRRTKAEMDAARAAEAETPAEEPATEAPEPEQEAAIPQAQEEAEAEAATEAPAAADGTVMEKYRKEAFEAASALLSSGGVPKVKAALSAVGASKVREVADDKLAEFIGLLK